MSRKPASLRNVADLEASLVWDGKTREGTRGYIVKCDDCKRTIRHVDTVAESAAGGFCDACRKCSKCGHVFGKREMRTRWDHGDGSIALCSPKCD